MRKFFKLSPNIRAKCSWIRCLAAAFILIVFIFFIGGGISLLKDKGSQGGNGARDRDALSTQTQLGHHNPEQMKSKVGRRAVNHPPASARSLQELKMDIELRVREQEASRSAIISNFDDDSNDYVLVAVKPPTFEQKAEIRTLMASLLKECQRSDRAEMDQFLSETERNYDPLGTSGKRAFFVTVSKGNDISHCSAYSFSVSDFEGLPALLDPKGGKRYTMRDVRWYQNPKGGVLERLSHIMH